MATSTAQVRTFFPVSRCDYTPGPQAHQRYRKPYGDARRAHRLQCLYRRICQRQTLTLNQLSDQRAEQVAYSRLLANPKLSLPELTHRLTQINPASVAGRGVLVLLDGSMVALERRGAQRRRFIRQCGVIGTKNTPGFHLLPALLVAEPPAPAPGAGSVLSGAVPGECLGLADVVSYEQPPPRRTARANRRQRRQRQALPLAQKQSGAWVRAAAGAAAQVLPHARRLTAVMDQGGDVLAVQAALRRDLHLDYIVRLKFDRWARLRLVAPPAPLAFGSACAPPRRLSRLLAAQPWRDVQTVGLRALDHHSKTRQCRRRRPPRMARLRLRTLSVQLSAGRGSEAGQTSLPLSAVEVREDASSVPAGQQPVHWCLLTSWPVETLAQAWAVVAAYRQRWHIEQLFRLLKKDGFGLPASQLDHPDRIKKLCVMALSAASQVLQLVNARQGGADCPAITTLFAPAERKVLARLNQYYRGSTPAQQNPHPATSLAWASWVIARLGGWKGYARGRPAGPQTMARGLERFYLMCRYEGLCGDETGSGRAVADEEGDPSGPPGPDSLPAP